MKNTRKIAFGLSVLVMLSLSGCRKKVECNIEESHIHRYINEEGLTRLYLGEYEKNSDYFWTNDYVLSSSIDENLVSFLQKNKLNSISDNLDYLNAQLESNQGYWEYEYYDDFQVVDYYFCPRMGRSSAPFDTYLKTYSDYDGDIQTKIVTCYNIPHYKTVTRDDNWSINPDVDRPTGMKRFNTYTYTCYRIITNDKGKYILEKSEPVLDPYEISLEYPYFNPSDFAKIVEGNKVPMESLTLD